MATEVYPRAKQQFLQATLNMSADDIVALLADATDYTPAATDDFLDDIPAGAREEVSAALTSKTFTDGAFDSDNPTWPATSGDACDYVILYNDTPGADSAKDLIYRGELDTISGLPVTLGGNVALTVDAAGWFAL